MLRLMLLRHAKSSWASPGMDDKDRPLSPRGARAAPAIGAYMRGHELVPKLVLCSSARRARDTWNLVANELTMLPKLIVDDTLYDFGDGRRLMQALVTKAAGAQAVMIVGHNPAIENLARRLIGKGDAKLRQLLQSKYPTGALTIIDFNTKSWGEVKDGSGILSAFTRPRDLEVET